MFLRGQLICSRALEGRIQTDLFCFDGDGGKRSAAATAASLPKSAAAAAISITAAIFLTH